MAPFDRLLARGALTKEQAELGERLREDWVTLLAIYRGDLDRVDRSRRDVGPTSSKIAAQRRLNIARNCLGGPLAKVVSAVLVPEDNAVTLADLGHALFGRRDSTAAEAATIEVLKVALDTLIERYGPRLERVI